MSLILQVLKDKKRLENIQFTVALVGSRKLAPNEGSCWEELAPNLTIYGFDVDEEACEFANAIHESKASNWIERHIPVALANSTGEANVYVTKAVHCSSLYAPNEAYLRRFEGMDQGIKLEFTVEISVTTLDEFVQAESIHSIDFLQVDVQGADLDVLQGAASLLEKSVLGIIVETEFSPLYQGQPLFADIDKFLRDRGFLFFDLITDDGWCRRPRAVSPLRSAHRSGQLLWADACYFRDPIIENANPVMQNPDQILKLACIADVLGYVDYALELLQHLTVTHGTTAQYNFAPEIMAILSSFPEMTSQTLAALPIVQQIQPFLNSETVNQTL